MPSSCLRPAPENAVKVAGRIREAVKKECPATVSIGISSFHDHGATVEGLIKGADRALYQAKARGKRSGRRRLGLELS